MWVLVVEDQVDLGDVFPLAGIDSWWPMLPFLAMAGALYVIGVRRDR